MAFDFYLPAWIATFIVMSIIIGVGLYKDIKSGGNAEAMWGAAGRSAATMNATSGSDTKDRYANLKRIDIDSEAYEAIKQFRKGRTGQKIMAWVWQFPIIFGIMFPLLFIVFFGMTGGVGTLPDEINSFSDFPGQIFIVACLFVFGLVYLPLWWMVGSMTAGAGKINSAHRKIVEGIIVEIKPLSYSGASPDFFVTPAMATTRPAMHATINKGVGLSQMNLASNYRISIIVPSLGGRVLTAARKEQSVVREYHTINRGDMQLNISEKRKGKTVSIGDRVQIEFDGRKTNPRRGNIVG